MVGNPVHDRYLALDAWRGLAALGVVAACGVIYLSMHPRVAQVPVDAGARDWLQSMLLLLFAYGGYEAALNPMGEAKSGSLSADFTK